MHHHLPSVWSGVYYVSVPQGATPDSGKIVFRVSEGGYNALGVGVEEDQTDVNFKKTKPKEGWCRYVVGSPQPGDLILFPSWLKHLVLPLRSKDPRAVRISVAFNA